MSRTPSSPIRPLRAAFSAAIVSLALALGGCMIGNSSSNDCTSADPHASACMCSGIGNCDRACVGGNCQFHCGGTTNCNFTCEGGGCDLTCENTGNCILDCPGCGCTLHCSNTGNCIQMGCNDAGATD
jgi:hypothetical protein